MNESKPLYALEKTNGQYLKVYHVSGTEFERVEITPAEYAAIKAAKKPRRQLITGTAELHIYGTAAQ